MQGTVQRYRTIKVFNYIYRFACNEQLKLNWTEIYDSTFAKFTSRRYSKQPYSSLLKSMKLSLVLQLVLVGNFKPRTQDRKLVPVKGSFQNFG